MYEENPVGGFWEEVKNIIVDEWQMMDDHPTQISIAHLIINSEDKKKNIANQNVKMLVSLLDCINV